MLVTHPAENPLLEDDREQRSQGSNASRKARPLATSPSARFPLELPSWACCPRDLGAAMLPVPLIGAEPT